MASTPLLSFRPAGTRTFAAAPGDPRPGRKAGKAGSVNWWAPVFGWSSEPDYIGESVSGADEEPVKRAAAGVEIEAPETRNGTGRSVTFTDDKARRLRMMTAETSAFHDIMYHSAIASRLASDFTGRSDD